MKDYKSPIELFESPFEFESQIKDISKQIQEQKENHIFQCIANIGVNVDKEELIKALQYDRHQYEKGYKDGFDDGVAEQQAEIERLNEVVNGTENSFNKMTELYHKAFKRYKTAKSEAIKEFAERLKEKLYSIPTIYNSHFGRMVDNLVKEMTTQPIKVEHNSLCETESYKGGAE